MSRARSSLAAAFTLIELLTVIAIIGILAAITLGVSRGVQERAAISQARSELAALATALEAYKRQYGDYPQTVGTTTNNPAVPSPIPNNDGPGILFNALVGKRGPTGAQINVRPQVDVSNFTLADPSALPSPSGTTQVNNAFVDPWGRRYLYYYKSGTNPADWTRPGYLLLSVGPDGNLGISVPSSGQFTISNAAQEADNIYAN